MEVGGELADVPAMQGDPARPRRCGSWKTEAAEEVQAAVALAQQEEAPDPFKDDWIVYASSELAEES